MIYIIEFCNRNAEIQKALSLSKSFKHILTIHIMENSLVVIVNSFLNNNLNNKH